MILALTTLDEPQPGSLGQAVGGGERGQKLLVPLLAGLPGLVALPGLVGRLAGFAALLHGLISLAALGAGLVLAGFVGRGFPERLERRLATLLGLGVLLFSEQALALFGAGLPVRLGGRLVLVPHLSPPLSPHRRDGARPRPDGPWRCCRARGGPQPAC